MLRDLARPAAFTLCIVALYAVFHTTFLTPALNPEMRIRHSLGLLAIAAGICLMSGMIFRDSAGEPLPAHASLLSSLPVQLFRWAAFGMTLLFLVSWYLETHCIFYRDIRY
jgi:hypothetical protein